MKPRNDTRRLRLYRVKTAEGELSADPSADVWQDDGKIRTSGLWEGLVPFSAEDVGIQANRIGVTPLEMMRRRLLCCSGVRVEVL